MEFNVLTGNFGARFNPSEHPIEAALRGERWEDSGKNWQLLVARRDARHRRSHLVCRQGQHGVNNVEKPWTPTMDFRYTGIKNMALYASWNIAPRSRMSACVTRD